MALALMVATAPVQAGPGTRPIPPNASPYGMTYGEWSALWWQWVYGIPASQNPLLADSRTVAQGAPEGSIYDPTGALCGESQPDHVWFLGGTFAVTSFGGNFFGSAVRNCNIPAGTAIFFPILNGEWDNFFPPPTYTADQLREIIVKQMQGVKSLTVEVDGQPVPGVTIGSAYEVVSPVFTITLAPGNLYGVPVDPGTTISSIAVSDGYWVMLRPLSKGQHTLYFAGTISASNPDGSVTNFSLDITYHLNIG